MKCSKLAAAATCGMLILLGSAGPGTAQGTSSCTRSPWFTGEALYATGAGPTSLAVGDFDQNGLRDVAVANAGAGLSVHLHFGSPFHIPVGSQPSSVTAGDLNGDGVLDLVVANAGSHDLSVLIGNGPGSFSAAGTISGFASPSSVALVDLDADGDLDIAVANEGSATIAVLLGDGQGAFGVPQPYATGLQPSSLAAGDLDGDGDLDLAVALAAGGVAVHLGDGLGNLGLASILNAGAGPSHVAIGDLDADGHPDLAVTHAASDSVTILAGDGQGAFAASGTLPVGSNPNSVHIGDLNLDGHPDLAVAIPASGFSVLLGDGQSAFSTPWPFFVGTVGSQPQLRAMDLADIDGDGRLDLAAAVDLASPNPWSSVTMMRNATQLLPPGMSLYQAGIQSLSVSVGDLTLDGHLDLVTANVLNGDISVFPGDGQGRLARPTRHGAGLQPHATVISDFDEDGCPDVAVANMSSHDVTLLLGDGQGGLVSGGSHPYVATSYPYPAAWDMVPGDFNGDQHTDLAIANLGWSEISILLGDGCGSFGPPTILSACAYGWMLAVADFDGDGAQDLALTCPTGGVQVFLGDAMGGFQAGANLPVGTTPRGIVAADFNRDGLPDLATANSFSNDVSILLGDGQGGFAAAVSLPVGNGPSELATADLNRDGHLDLVIGNENSQDATILLGDGQGGFTQALMTTLGMQPSSIAVGDFDHDGIPDLAASSFLEVGLLRTGCLGPRLSLSQPGGPGTVLTIESVNLTPGHEYFNLFSIDLCPAGPGSGTPGLLGLCVSTLPNLNLLAAQLQVPVGTAPFHFIANTQTETFGPYPIVPITLEAVCADVTGAQLGLVSPVVRYTIQ